MAKYRQVHISFWQDPFIEELEPMQKYFYLYLMTNSKTTQSGCFEISNKLIKYETGLSQKEIDSFIELFTDNKKIVYSSDTNEFLILNWLKHNSFKSPKVKSCIQKEIESIKNEKFIDFINAVLEEEIGIDRLSIDYTRYIYSESENEIPVLIEVRNKNKKENKKENNNNNNNDNKKEIENFFEECWNLYPKKEGRASVSFTKKTELFKLGEQFKRCIQRYKEYIIAEKKEKQFIKQGSTFFNSGYVDYLDNNFIEENTVIKIKEFEDETFKENGIKLNF